MCLCVKVVLSRNYFLRENKVTDLEYMKKLNQKEIRWIVSEMKKGDRSAYRIAKIMNISPRRVRELYRVHQETGKNVLLSTLSQFQVLKSEFSLIVNNNIKLKPPQPAEWPPDNKCIIFGIGWISNPKYEFNGDEYYWSFNCEYVRCVLVDEYGRSYNRLFNNGQVMYLMGHPLLIQIITDHFLFTF